MYLTNIDTLMFSLDVQDYNDAISKYLEILESKKTLAQSYRADYSNEKAMLEIGGMSFEVLANGKKGYAYILQNADYEIDFATARSSQDNNYPVFIRVKQSVLWSKGVFDSYMFICGWISDNVGQVIAEKLNRVDLCCHTDTIPFSSYDIQSFKTRATKKNAHYIGSTINGFEFGSRTSTIYCRIYDKFKEITEKKKGFWFFKIWEKHGVEIGNVWNIEFELKRDFFREYEIESFIDFINNAGSIWDYLVKQWLVLVVSDHTRLENCSVLPQWSELANCFFIEKYKSFIRRDKQLSSDSEAIAVQILGYIKSYAAIENIFDLQAVIECVYADIKLYLDKNKKDFTSLVCEKAKLYIRG